MNQNLRKAGKTLLNALQRHSDLIMDVYLAGAVNESEQKPADIDKLMRLGVIWRPTDDADLVLKSTVRSFLEEALTDERNRQIDANIGSALSNLKALAVHYKEAKNKHRFSDADVYLSQLTEQVYGLIDSLRRNVRFLWERIHKEFGYVSSIEAKIRENELAQAQVSELLKQIELFKFNQLSREAGSDRDLRRLMVVTLQNTFTDITQELSLVQGRLLELLGRFREFQGRTRLLKGFLLHMEQKPDYQPADYTNHSKIPELFNQSESVIKPASADVNDTENEAVMLDIVGRIKALQHFKTNQNIDRSADIVKVEAQQEVELQEDIIKQAVESYIMQIIDTGQSVKALDYYQMRSYEFDKEVWIYQVLGGYESLSDEDKQYFAIERTGAYHPTFNGNYIIEDVAIGLK